MYFLSNFPVTKSHTAGVEASKYFPMSRSERHKENKENFLHLWFLGPYTHKDHTFHRNSQYCWIQFLSLLPTPYAAVGRSKLCPCVPSSQGRGTRHERDSNNAFISPIAASHSPSQSSCGRMVPSAQPIPLTSHCPQGITPLYAFIKSFTRSYQALCHICTQWEHRALTGRTPPWIMSLHNKAVLSHLWLIFLFHKLRLQKEKPQLCNLGRERGTHITH